MYITEFGMISEATLTLNTSSFVTPKKEFVPSFFFGTALLGDDFPADVGEPYSRFRYIGRHFLLRYIGKIKGYQQSGSRQNDRRTLRKFRLHFILVF